MSPTPHPGPLAQEPCQSRCHWLPVEQTTRLPRLACTGCGSQWDRSQAWTPRDLDGSIPPGVQDLRG
ncbi:hypothetical protein [Angustibacter luteus]|uniref:GATA-type domain-containing protein n=1 Tax=Angustibacter luteus TaxID=658456 RepID=A0ABW1JIN5_9ACTN